MKNQIYLIILLLVCNTGIAQNLVTNGDFEQYYSCPTLEAQIDTAVNWFGPTAPGTPDYYHVCCPNTFVGVPYHASGDGYQLPKSGDAYTGIFIYRSNFTNIREYIETQLTSPLVANSCYHFEMFVNLSNNCNYTSDDLGVYFSDTVIAEYTAPIDSFLLPFTPQINNSTGNIITDTLNWTLISGNYTAQGGELFLLIGNFKHDSVTTAVVVNNNISAYNYAYFYIEDVSLTPCTNINEEIANSGIHIYPNPFKDNLNVTAENNELFEIIIYDITSGKILQHQFTNSVRLDTKWLAKGIYLYEVKNQQGLIAKGKLLKD